MTQPTRRFRRIALARHGETDYNLHRRFQGWLAVPLNDRGRAQAADLAEAAAALGFEELWTSPLARAAETAAIVGRRLDLEPREEPRLAETDTGAWTDRPFAEVQAEDPVGFGAFVAGDPGFSFPGGESFAGQSARVMAALTELAARERRVLAVCHGVVIRLTLARLGLAEGHGSALAPTIPNAGLVALDPDAPRG